MVDTNQFGELSKFKTNFSQGIRKNRFMVDFSSIAGTGISAPQNLKWLVAGTTLPGLTVGEIEIRWQGLGTSYVGDPSTNLEWAVTFLNDKKQEAYKFIENWIQFKANPADNTRAGNVTEYTFPITVHQLDENGQVLYSYVLHNAQPISISDLSRDNEPVSEWDTFDVSFKFDFRTYLPYSAAEDNTAQVSTAISTTGKMQ